MEIMVNGIKCDDLVYREPKKSTIKVIDLLNKIAKGEEVPKKIIIDNTIFERTASFDITQMYNFWDGSYNHFWLTTYTLLLDEEVEIIEEEKNTFSGLRYFENGELIMSLANEQLLTGEGIEEAKNIEELKISQYANKQKKLAKKINELVKAVNELKKGN